jgi:DNA polymerase-1
MESATQPTAQTLYLIDGSALAYRSHFAFIRNPLVTRQGKIVSAVFGYTSTLLRILEQEHPTHIAVVFDAPGKTFRHERFADYKATREKMPEELVDQLDDITAVTSALSIPLIRQEGIEADDVIGTLAARAADSGFDVRIVSGDKDFMQLVTDRVLMYSLGRGNEASGEILGADAVEKKFGVAPGQIIDLLALMGDSSDNVPGVPRVGQKTATQLIQTHGSLDGIYRALEEIKKPALKKTLGEHREQADLSRELVTILTDVDVPYEVEELRCQDPDRVELRRLFQDFEFKSLMDKIPSAEAPPPIEVDYVLVDTRERLDALLAALRAAPIVSLDTETTHLDPLLADLVGLSFSWAPGHAAYVPVRSGEGLFGKGRVGLPFADIKQEIGALLADSTVKKAGQNLKYDLHVLERAGLPVEGITFDTMLAHYCYEPSAVSHGLDALAVEFFQYQKITTREVLGKGRNQITMAEAPSELVSDYACEDADYTLRLVGKLSVLLEERKVGPLFRDLEMPLLSVLKRMEARGVRLDTDALEKLQGRFHDRAAELEKSIHALAGQPFNVNSPKQLGEILYEKLEIHKERGVKRVPRTKTGYSTNAAALQLLEGHPLVDQVLEYRQLVKLLSTYVEALPQLVHKDTGRIHTSFNQAVAATGRLSSSDPNLQNIPIRTPLGREIRRAFRSSFDGGTLLSADYSQVELRILSHVSADAQLIEAFQDDQDIHQRTASLIFEVDPDAVDREMRTRAKAINFGIIYGMGAQRLSRETGLTHADAKAFIERYFEVFSGVKQYIDTTLEHAEKDGYVTTLLDRRRYIPEIQSGDGRVQANARNVAVNTPIQGTAADLIKLAMIRADDRIRESGCASRMILQVHDELVFDVAPGESAQIRALAREAMEGALELKVRLKVDIGEGETWLDAH